MLQDASLSHMVCWGADGTSIVIREVGASRWLMAGTWHCFDTRTHTHTSLAPQPARILRRDSPASLLCSSQLRLLRAPAQHLWLSQGTYEPCRALLSSP